MSTAAHSGLAQAGYELGAVVRRPGLGAVHEARAPGGAPVWVWLLPPGGAVTPERFLDDARALSEARGRGLPKVLDSGEAPEGLYLATEPFAASSLDDLVGRGEGLAPARVVRLLGEAADALDAAHTAGVLHRMLRPEALLIQDPPLERCHLADFALGLDRGFFRPDSDGLAYAAPEELRDRPATPATDRYSFACVAFEALTGAPPFTAQTAEDLREAHLLSPPPRATAVRDDLPSAVDEAFETGLSKNPAGRPETAADLVAALARALLAGRAAARRPGRTAASSEARKDATKAARPLADHDADGDGQAASAPAASPKPARPPADAEASTSGDRGTASGRGREQSGAVRRTLEVFGLVRPRMESVRPARERSGSRDVASGRLRAPKGSEAERGGTQRPVAGPAASERGSRTPVDGALGAGAESAPGSGPAARSAKRQRSRWGLRTRRRAAGREAAGRKRRGGGSGAGRSAGADPSAGRAEPKSVGAERTAASAAGSTGGASAALDAGRSGGTEQRAEKDEDRRGGAGARDAGRRHRGTGGSPSARRRRPLALGAVAVLLASSGVAGWLYGQRGDETAARAGDGSAGVRVDVPDGWSRVTSIPEVPGLELSGPVAARRGGAAMVAGVVPAVVFPERIGRQVDESALEPETLRVGKAELFRWRGLRSSAGGDPMTLFATPTSEGLAVLACMGRGGRGCEGAAGSLGVPGAEAASLDELAFYGTQVAQVLERLDARRAGGVAALRDARARAGQARAARSLATANRRAARVLSALAVPAVAVDVHPELMAALRSAGGAYDRLAAAARRGDRRAYGQAARAVERRERGLGRVVAAL